MLVTRLRSQAIQAAAQERAPAPLPKPMAAFSAKPVVVKAKRAPAAANPAVSRAPAAKPLAAAKDLPTPKLTGKRLREHQVGASVAAARELAEARAEVAACEAALAAYEKKVAADYDAFYMRMLEQMGEDAFEEMVAMARDSESEPEETVMAY